MPISRFLSPHAERHVATLTREISTSRGLEPALTTALDAAITLLLADCGNIQLYRAGVLAIAVHRGLSPSFLERFQRVAADDDCACGRAMRDGRATIIPDVMLDPEFASFRGIAEESGFRAVQSTPLVTTSGLFIGMLSTHFREPHTPSDEEMTMLGLYATAVADTIQRFVAQNMLTSA
ncbi:MAG: GAF domain-containing protein [Alphaproteobacteria bacterium]|nr:GAF domain-containing protein [Alphaproteobacteria bacterium]